MGRKLTNGGLLRYRKWVPQQLEDVIKQGSGDSRPMGARHGNTAANHTDLQSGCGRTCVFAVRVWSNLWKLIWLRISHYSTIPLQLCSRQCWLGESRAEKPRPSPAYCGSIDPVHGQAGDQAPGSSRDGNTGRASTNCSKNRREGLTLLVMCNV